MLALLVGDAHITGKNPICRTDDLATTQFEKWEEIVEYANKKDCPIISVGDLFHTSIVANSTVNSLGAILNKLKNPLYFVWGNHDLLYHSIEIWNRTSLGTLLTNNKNVKHISEFNRDYSVLWDYVDWDDETVQHHGAKLLLSHRSIINRKLESINFWTGQDESFAKVVGRWSKSYRIIVCGHWHKPYHFKHGKTIVINPGPVSRINTEDKLQPSVCLLNLETGIFNRHYLQSAKPFDEVISDKHIKNKINNSDNIKKFIAAIGKTSKYDSAFMDNLMQIIDNHMLDDDVESLLIDILAKPRERKVK